MRASPAPNSMVAQGKLRSAVRVATSRDGGGVYAPEDADTKSGRRVIDVLRDKHPDMVDPDIGAEGWMSFEDYEELPGMLSVNCDQEIVKTIAGKLSGGAGPDSVDGKTLKHYLIGHGKASQTLREEMALWVELLCNTMIPWARIRTLMENRLCALDKQPGVRPLGIGCIIRRLIAKCALKAGGADAKAACGSKQLCAGLEAGIEGAMHAAWEKMGENS